jgi:hypothetical protein
MGSKLISPAVLESRAFDQITVQTQKVLGMISAIRS